MLQCSKRLLRASLGVSSLNSGRLRAVFFSRMAKPAVC
jgi:hypothetical protein